MNAVAARLRRGWRSWVQRRIPPSRQIQLTQRSIFILPSRQGWVFIVALVAMFIGGVNYGNSLILALTFFLAGLLFVAILQTFRNLAGVTLTYESSEAGFVGEFVMYVLHLTTSKAYSHESIELSFPGLELHVSAVEPKQASEVKIFVPAVSRGLQKPGRLRVQTVFPLGLMQAWSWVDLSLHGVVYPKPIQGPVPFTESGDDTSSPITTVGQDDFAGLNSYQPGDSLSRVYWKVLARGLPLATKSFETPVSEACWLSLAQVEGDLEAKLSILAYWVLKKAETNAPYGLVLGEQRFSVNTGLDHKKTCLLALALYGTGQQIDESWDPAFFLAGEL